MKSLLKQNGQRGDRVPRLAVLRPASVLLAGLGLTGVLTGCVVVGASSRGGFFVWPGGLGLLVLVLVLVFALRRR